MAMHCNKCGGIIPDIIVDDINGFKRSDCKYHSKPEVNMDLKRPPLG